MYVENVSPAAVTAPIATPLSSHLLLVSPEIESDSVRDVRAQPTNVVSVSPCPLSTQEILHTKAEVKLCQSLLFELNACKDKWDFTLATANEIPYAICDYVRTRHLQLRLRELKENLREFIDYYVGDRSAEESYTREVGRNSHLDLDYYRSKILTFANSMMYTTDTRLREIVPAYNPDNEDGAKYKDATFKKCCDISILANTFDGQITEQLIDAKNEVKFRLHAAQSKFKRLVEEHVEKVVVPSISSNNAENCCVCLEKCGLDAVTPCGHSYHAKCLGIWLANSVAESKSPTCGVCRQHIDINDVKDLSSVLHTMKDLRTRLSSAEIALEKSSKSIVGPSQMVRRVARKRKRPRRASNLFHS